MRYEREIDIGGKIISSESSTYFIADIAANHDGDLERAKALIWLAKGAGADCAKFQHFLAGRIVSDVGFSNGVGQVSHQASWKNSVAEVYDKYHTRRDWTETLIQTCRQADIEFMTTPYDEEAVLMFADVVSAYKIGSGDISFLSLLQKMAEQGKPLLLATGAADMLDVEQALETILAINPKLCLMQCNTNYTGDVENFRYVNLNVLKTFAERWPGMPLGLSDHTPGHSAVLGAVALGARVIEKHFTDDNERIGPDHSFALNPVTWRAMVDATRELEMAMGDGVKRVEGNETETVVIQRRALRFAVPVAAGTPIENRHLEALRPCPEGAVSPARIGQVIGRRLKADKELGKELMWADLD